MKAVMSMLIVLAMVQLMVNSGEAITCDQVDTCLMGCIPYLISGGNPTVACCEGLQNLMVIIPTTANRQAACNCIKAAASSFQNMNENAASTLAQKCGIHMSIPISRGTNCATIN